jgi:hypothetical protein
MSRCSIAPSTRQDLESLFEVTIPNSKTPTSVAVRKCCPPVKGGPCTARGVNIT